MFNVRIEIIGPGRCFDAEYNLLLSTLKEAGYNVVEENKYPCPEFKGGNGKKPKIELVANHMPWGG